ncbi:hypothetical protein DSM106972_091790 [Dulcicalothrix desertica PCC 7102]|uniref:Uncharacterized protein n=1 Tax=Dulcicalothrix desertica PCC 7102 TaxID=232991 RepID=A0A433UM60_9CYAN|nr:hypothetical protein [Dulcicalothrix desertica]RUS94928.1 hypothetical protein DSM106972_091790 [Dulcicalothrix desertica PCC 7102]TWH62701.1 hypothetical protein CAL7102_00214 [Dulcicalothrix desertica PCC 7102]
MSKFFNEYFQEDKVYSSLKNQIVNLINERSTVKKNQQLDNDLVPVFSTTENRFPVLRKVVRDLAIKNPHLNFQVFDGDFACLVSEHIPLKEEFSYTWVEKSPRTGKYLVMARPPAASRKDSLCVWKNEVDARNVAQQILNKIREFPIQAWDAKHSSDFYKKFLRTLPDDDDEILGLVNPNDGSVTKFNSNAQKTVNNSFNKVLQGEISREEFYTHVNAATKQNGADNN